jgi:hypothetical protein
MRYSYTDWLALRGQSSAFIGFYRHREGNLHVFLSNLFNLLSLSCFFIFFLLGEATSFNCYCHTFFFSKRKIIWRGNQVLLSCVVFLCVRLATRVMAILVDDKPMQIKRRESVLVSWISRGKLYFIYICKYMKFSYRFYSVLLNKHFVFEETLALCALFKG